MTSLGLCYEEALFLKLEEVENELNIKVTLDKLQLAESIWSFQKESKNTENFFVDEKERFDKCIQKVGKALCKKVLKVDPNCPLTIKNVMEITKEFEIIVQVNHLCICNALKKYWRTSEVYSPKRFPFSMNS